MCNESRIEWELTWEKKEVFEDEEVREAMRRIQYKKETNKNYITGFIDRTPTTVLEAEF